MGPIHLIIYLLILGGICAMCKCVCTRYEVSVIKGLSTYTNNVTRIHCTVLKAHCAWGKSAKCENL